MPNARRTLFALALALAVVVAFLPSLENGFVNFDDHLYVTDNAAVRGGLSLAGVRWALGAEVAGHWQPVTLLSHMLDAQLFGLQPRGHHLTSMLIHALNAVLLFLLFNELTGAAARAAALAALWALHPMRVESVAWIAERKDVLCGTFFVLTLIAYVRWARTGSRIAYGAALAAFALGLMAKAMLVTLPCVLLLLDFWPLDRAAGPSTWWPRVREKWPFFALTAASSWMTLHHQWALHAPERFMSTGARAANTAIAYFEYLRLTLWPSGLAVLYPLPETMPWTQLVLAAATLVVVSASVWRRRRAAPYLAVGWCWFLGVLMPVNGLLDQGGAQSWADRYTYLPSVGLWLALVWSIANWVARSPVASRRAAVSVGLGLALVAETLATRRQVTFWHDDTSLWRRAVAMTGPNYVAEVNLGAAELNAGHAAAAANHFGAAVGIAPESLEARAGHGDALRLTGQTAAAIAELRAAVELRPDDSRPHFTLALALLDAGDGAAAHAELVRTLELDPGFAPAARVLAELEKPATAR